MEKLSDRNYKIINIILCYFNNCVFVLNNLFEMLINFMICDLRSFKIILNRYFYLLFE